MKLVNATKLDNDLQNIANKIREKNGTTGLLSFPNDFNTEINKSYTIEDYASKNFLSNIIYLPTATAIHSYAFSNSSITEIHAPNVTRLAPPADIIALDFHDYIFKNCQNLTLIDFPNLSYIRGESIFYGCENLTSIYLPELTDVSDTYNKIFHNASGVKTIFLPKCPSLHYMFKDLNNLETVCLKGNFMSQYNYPIQTFANCPNLIGVDIFDNIQSLRESFLNDTKLKTVILRYSSKIISLYQTTTFDGTPFSSSGTGGTLYVPRDLISSYQSATNWSVILNYSNNQILPIEESIYANQYLNGISLGG